MKVFVEIVEALVDSYRSPERFGSWYDSGEFYVKGVSLRDSEDHDTEEIETGVDILTGSDVYVVSMIYDTGDSFGRHTGCGR